MGKEVEGLVRSQTELYGRIARAYDNLKKSGAANITTGLVEARLQCLETNWKKFETQHDRLVTEFWDQLAELDYQKKDLPSLVEETYVTQRGMFLDILHTLKGETNAVPLAAQPEASRPARTTLPRIQLPTFSGRYEDWPPFRDLFHSIIGKEDRTTPVEKLHYLKSCLKGEAELLVRNLPTTDENFDRAWTILKDYFENKRLLVRSYLSRFTSLQKLKGESASDLRNLNHCVMSTVGSLESIGRPLSNNDLFVHMIIELLDAKSRREWEREVSETTDPPSYEVLQQFLDRRLHTLDSLQPIKPEAASSKPSGNNTKARSLHAKKQDGKRGRCSMCQKEHFLLFCAGYKAKTATERKQHVETNDLCLNCLGNHKLVECMSTRTCNCCNARHHTSLHDACVTQELVKSSNVAQRPLAAPFAILLATARVRVVDRYGITHNTRALIDQGSEGSLVSESLVQRLRLARSPTTITIYGIGGKQSGRARGLVNLEISALKGGAPLTVAALILPQLTIYTGGIRANALNWAHLRDLELADPDYLASDPVELLLGAEVCASILLPGLRKGTQSEPVAQQTSLGWIISGAVGEDAKLPSSRAHCCRIEEDLTAMVKRFWEQEELANRMSDLTQEEKNCEEHFVRTHSRNADGRYVVRLPLAGPLPELRGTRGAATRALNSIERRFVRDNELRCLYEEFMRQYEELAHMTLARSEEAESNRVCYLPHHGVLREASSTTKLRVVFNGSSSSMGTSLNKCLLIGQNLLPALDDVLLRWRRHRYVLAADVEKMYRQILVHTADRDLQRILWRYNKQEPIREYRLNTVTYGLASAPFLAMRTLRQLADDEEKRFPRASEVLRRDVYMDDVLTGAESLKDAQELQHQLHELCMAGGFPLRKWSTNETCLLAGIPPEHLMKRELRAWKPQESHGTLGLQWHPGVDCFSFTVRLIPLKAVTKRTVLSLMARLFDPLGWLAPTVVSAKIAFQATWLKGLDWDDPLDEAEVNTWREFQEELPWLEQIRVPRRIYPDSPLNESEIHGFADASERAYAAVLYLRVKSESGDWHCNLLAAKTRVAPLKQVALPRLELCAAVILARLAVHVRATLDLLKIPLHLWSDSTVALSWIQGHPTRWTTYVANRVSEIQTAVPEAVWHHIPGRDNPADCASRGLAPRNLVSHSLWWGGPSCLQEDSFVWPPPTVWSTTTELPEQRTRAHTGGSTLIPEADELLRFSSLHRLLRVTAWCRRWLPRRPANGSLGPAHSDELSAEELEESRLSWIRAVQEGHHSRDLMALRQGNALAKSNPLLKLNPFLDSLGIMRVGGRLKHAVLAYDGRHPVILPRESHFTRLVVEAGHRRALHGGVQMTLGFVRQQYWIPRGRAVVKKTILRCVTCARWRADTAQQLMGDLPRERITPARPFLHTGVDYAGPMLLRTARGRGHKAYKAFVAVFVCLSTRAVHLEAVSDYTAAAFLAALRRFMSRRGLCRTIRSDCGTNFAGADAQLRALFSASSQEGRQIANQLASDQIQWQFNPPGAPHFGGVWEAAVKSLKHHLRRVLGDTTLTFEEMSTLLSQIEACLNSRPLQALSDDPEDLTALTPGHFLIGSALVALPEPSLQEEPINRLTRWQLIQSMRDHFWSRWSEEYLHSLIYRPKWRKVETNLQVGRLCLVRKEATPPTKWPLARIVRTHPGDDGHVRVVTIRTSTTELTRPISKIVPLPIEDSA